MSIKLMSEVFNRYPEGGGEMLLALAIADHAHDDGTHIYPSIKNLALKTRQSERTVQYQLRKMESDGWLILVDCEFGGRSKTREYKINDDWVKGADFAPIKKGAIQSIKGAIQSIKGATDDIKGAIAVAPESSRTIKNHQKPSIDKSSDFEDFWKAYPNKTGKQDALRKWLKIKPPLQKIMLALDWQRDSQQWQQGFIPNPATYLHQHRWEDEPRNEAIPQMSAKQQQITIAARSVFGNNERIIEGEVNGFITRQHG